MLCEDDVLYEGESTCLLNCDENEYEDGEKFNRIFIGEVEATGCKPCDDTCLTCLSKKIDECTKCKNG